MAIITSNTGTTVHSVAFNTESHKTSGASASTLFKGRKSTNCPMHRTQATLVASPTRRSEPRRCTSSPLYDR